MNGYRHGRAALTLDDASAQRADSSVATDDRARGCRAQADDERRVERCASPAAQPRRRSMKATTLGSGGTSTRAK